MGCPAGGPGKLHTLIAYPPGEGKVGVVVPMSHEPGLDDWMRAADQVAHDGFIAIAPDLLTGRGPRGGQHRCVRLCSLRRIGVWMKPLAHATRSRPPKPSGL